MRYPSLARSAWLALVWAGVVVSAAAQGASADWSVGVWTTADGLAGNNVTGLAQDRDGFLWIVAGGRLQRFDGARLESFAPEPGPNETESPVRSVRRAHNGDLLWLRQDGAIARARAGQVTLLADRLPDARAESFVEDAEGGILIAFHNGAVFRRTDAGLFPLGEAEGLPAGRSPATFANDRDGRAWFAKGGAVGVCRDGRFETLLRMEDSQVRLTGARDGGVWACVRLQLLRLRAGAPAEKVGDVPAVNRETVASALLEDDAGAVWIGTSISGLVRYRDGSFEQVPVSHRQVVSLAQDREGSVWVGTSGGGVNQVQPRAIQIEGRETGIPFPAVQAICEDLAGGLWAIAQDGSPVRRVGHEWVRAFAENAGFEGEATCIASDAEGGIWIGTKNQRVYRWHGGRLQGWGAAEGVRSVLHRALHVGRNGDVWLAAARPGALLRFRGGRCEAVALPRAVESVWAVTETPDGTVWAGGSDRFLARISETAVAEVGASSVPDTIRALHATPDGAVWIGYMRSGLGYWHEGRLGRVTSREGLIDDNLRMVISDRQGALWLVGVTTVSKVRRQELVAVASGQAAQVQPVQYGPDQGVHAVIGGAVGALLAHDGRLWLPLATSLAIIQPERQLHRPDPPPVFLTRVAADERELLRYGGVMPGKSPPGDAVARIAPEHARLTFEFTALSFSSPGNVRFRYRLENFDQDWVDAGTQRSASYSRLRAGDYVFRVKASSGDGVWNEEGATLRFVVPPYWWETWWFRAATVLAFTIGVAAIVRYFAVNRLSARLRAAEQEAAVERERARIARDIHDDLGGRLTKIALLSGLAARDQSDPPRASAHVREIAETTRQLMQSLDETVWTVNPRNDSLPHLISYVGQFAVNFLRTAEIACRLDLPLDPPPLPVRAEVRHHLLLAVKEALTNVVRHAGAREVRVRVEYDDRRIAFVVEDDGRGFTAEVDAAGADGLRNMRQRMEQIGGVFDLDTGPGRGTRLTLGIPRVAAAS